jgi:hypothetical protein
MAIYRCEACGREKPGPPAPFCEGGEMTHRRATMKPVRDNPPAQKVRGARPPRH